VIFAKKIIFVEEFGDARGRPGSQIILKKKLVL
jgi:hypothetical protein